MSLELDMRVAVAIGYKFWLETRGEYLHIVAQKPGDREPWFSVQSAYRDKEKKRYTPFAVEDFNPMRHIPSFGFRFSTDANEAAALWAEHLPGCAVYAPAKPGERWCVIDRDGHREWAVGSTLAEAICRAVIAVKGAQ